MATEYERYYPSKDKRYAKYPWQFKTGKYGRAHRSNTLGVSAARRKQLRENPGKWFATSG